MHKYLLSEASYLTDIIPLPLLLTNETTIDTILSTKSNEFLTHINVFASKIHFTPVSLVSEAVRLSLSLNLILDIYRSVFCNKIFI